MAFPTVAGTSVGSTGAGANVTSHTINLPGSIASGDLLIAFLSMDGSRSDDDAGWPGGWTEITAEDAPDAANATSGVSLNIAYRIADGSEGASITYTTVGAERGSYWVARITGWHGTTPPEDGASSISASANCDGGQSLSPSWGSDDTLWIVALATDSNITPSAAPTNFSNLVTQNDGTTGGAGINIARRTNAAASEDPGAWTNSAVDAVSVVVAVRPAAGGASDTAPAEHIAVTGAANAASANVQPNAAPASATGAASSATANVQPSAAAASATAAAHQPSIDVKATPTTATATGAAHDATASTAAADTAEAEHVAATGASHQPSVSVAATTGTASATGEAHQPSVDVKATAGHASGTGAAYDATVSTATQTNASAEHASATGAAHQPSVSVKASSSAAAATGEAYTASGSVAPNAGTGSATGAANQPAPSVAATAGHASATGEAFDATVTTTGAGQANAEHAAATATAHDATVQVEEDSVAPSGGVRPRPEPVTRLRPLQMPRPMTWARAGHASARAAAHTPSPWGESEGWLFDMPSDEHLLLVS